MSDPNDAWQSAPSGDNYGDRSPRRDDGGRSPPPPERRARSRSPAQRNGGGGGGGGGGGDNPVSNPGNNLHVSGLARSVDQRALEEMFNRHGKVVSAQLMLDPHTQESRGFGFVKLESVSEAEAAIEALNGTSIDGKTLTVAHARRGRARTPTPGRYQGVKVEIGGPRGYGGGGYGGGYDRPYQPRSYDSRYADRGPPRGYDDRRYDDRRYDDRPRYEDRGRYDDRRDDRRDYRDRYEERGPPPPPVAGDRDPYYRSEPRGAAPYERREERPRYDDRPRY